MLTLIWAMTENGVIGRDHDLPWDLPDDMKHFMLTTKGHAVIMGRKTYETVGKPLPGRTNIVITRSLDYVREGAVVVHDLDAAIEHAQKTRGAEEVFVTGGSEIYRLALPRADRLNVTVIHTSLEGDTHFPAVDWSEWELRSERYHDLDERHAYALSFRVYERAK